MPTTYAHLTFGEKVLENLDTEVKGVITSNLPLFHIGLHGPDILFYNNPLGSSKINRIGSKMHDDIASDFFKRGKKIINHCPNKNAATAYLLGFICHYMLDSECHPYVDNQTLKISVSHLEIEAEFDRMLMINNSLDPLTFKPTKHIIATPYYAKCISWFYKDISGKEIISTLKSMKVCLNFLVAKSDLKRGFLDTIFKLSGSYEKMKGLVINKKANPLCNETNRILKELYVNAIIPTSEIINEFYKELSTTKPLNERFNRNFH